MTIAAAILAAALIVAPGLDESWTARLQDAYPQAAREANRSAAAVVSITIDPEGQVRTCRTEGIEGDAALGLQLCPIVTRIRVTPAQIDGQAVWSQATRLVTFAQPGTPEGDRVARLQQPPQFTVTVNHLPNGERAAEVRAALAIGPDGSVIGCSPSPGAPEELGQIACRQLSAGRFPSFQGAGGSLVSYVVPLRVGFVVAETPTGG